MSTRKELDISVAAAARLSASCADLDFLRAVNSGLQQYNSEMSNLYSATRGGNRAYTPSSIYEDDPPVPNYQPTYQPIRSSSIQSNSIGRSNSEGAAAEDCSRLTGIYRTTFECRQGKGRWVGAKACPVP